LAEIDGENWHRQHNRFGVPWPVQLAIIESFENNCQTTTKGSRTRAERTGSMSIKLASRVQAVKPSATLAITARAKELRAAGKDVIGLGAGEPDFDTPEHIKAAAIRSINDGFTKYTAVDGTPELKNAIIAKFRRENGFDYAGDQILVSCGGKQSFYNLAQAILDPGDEVIIPAPFWVSYPDMVLLAGGAPVLVHAGSEQSFKITPAQLKAAMTEKTKLVVINSPSNPTGMAYSREELQALGEVLLEHPRAVIATDDMYEHIRWSSDPFVNILNACPDLAPRTLVLNGVSKAYSMTGWRIGYAGGPADVIKAMKKVQSQSTSNPTSISQVAAQAALEGPQECIGTMLAAFKERHDYVVERLNAMSGVECLATDGTFYVFPRVEGMIDAIGEVNNDLELAEYLIEQAGVALVPGTAFGVGGHVRISIATSRDNLEKALDRIAGVLN
jgi:aspartate aminotransferase